MDTKVEIGELRQVMGYSLYDIIINGVAALSVVHDPGEGMVDIVPPSAECEGEQIDFTQSLLSLPVCPDTNPQHSDTVFDF